MLATAKRLGGPCSLMNCFVEGCTVQHASMKSMTDHIGRHFRLKVSVNKKKATQLFETRPQASQPDLQHEVDLSTVVSSSLLPDLEMQASITLDTPVVDMVENPLSDSIPRNVSQVLESQDFGALADADGEVSEMHSLFSASPSPTPPGSPLSSQALEFGNTSENAKTSTSLAELPCAPSQGNASRPALRSPLSNTKLASSAFSKVKTDPLKANEVALTLLRRIYDLTLP
jgi:hypothetical protein